MNETSLPPLAMECSSGVFPGFPMRKPRAKPIYKGHAKFTPAEDLRLSYLVHQHGTDSWRLIAQYMDGRNSRQCRERWLYYLDPDRNVHPWTEEEDALIERKYHELGARWTLMVPFFTHRTDSMIKNRFMVLKRKEKHAMMTAASAQGVQFVETFMPTEDDGFDHIPSSLEDWGAGMFGSMFFENCPGIAGSDPLYMA
jgi:hypothetical protein